MRDRVPASWVYAGLAAFVVAVIVAAWGPDLGHVEWGDAPTWVAGVIALLALLAAWRAGSIARELLKVEHGRNKRAEDADAERRRLAERQEQADRVAAWNNGDATILNGSDLPIWDVAVEFIDAEGEYNGTESRSVLPPGTTQIPFPFYVPPDEWSPGVPYVSDEWKRIQIEIRFRDAAGRRWRRDRHGILTLVGRDAFVDGVVAVALADAHSPTVTGEQNE